MTLQNEPLIEDLWYELYEEYIKKDLHELMQRTWIKNTIYYPTKDLINKAVNEYEFTSKDTTKLP